ncbi:MAG: T9SS type A sorting domain-containing protein [Bacteroidetes bacterium]|nr:T9SS type A sorting domain-containing protein [Bacteroidota bacterium]
MKQLLLSFSLILVLTEAGAQITITQSDFASPDDTVLVSVSDDLTLDLTGTGANYTWDYSNLHIASQRVDTFFNVADASALYQLQFNNIIFEPDYASDYYYDLVGFDLAGASGAGITVEKPVGFVKISSSAVENVGMGLTLNGYEVPMAADTIDMEYALPMTYTDSWTSDSYIYVDLNPAFNGIFQRYQYRTSTVDGWGSITTRFGTFDAIRVRSELAYDDSVYVDLGFGGTWLELPTPDEVHYTWWTTTNKIPVMKAVAQVIGGNETVTRVEFRDQSRNLAGIDEYADFAGTIYPNPASSMVNLTLDQDVNQVLIYNVAGAVVYQNTVTESVMNIDIQNWTNGIYLVKLIGDTGVSSAKLIIE